MITPILIMAVAAWAIAQVLKLLIASASCRKFAWRYLSTGGGMPSSHSAMVCACATGVAFSEGLDAPLFAIAAVLAFIVMYDASNVRWETGKQAKVLNSMMRSWSGKRSSRRCWGTPRSRWPWAPCWASEWGLWAA